MSVEPTAAASSREPWKEFISLGVNPQLVEALRVHLNPSRSAKTLKAYDADWARFCDWCEQFNVSLFPPDPKFVALYVTACASGHASVGGKPFAIATIERRLVAVTHKYAEAGVALHKSDYLKKLLTGVRRKISVPLNQQKLLDTNLPTIARLTRRHMQALLKHEITHARCSSKQQKDEEPNFSKALGL